MSRMDAAALCYRQTLGWMLQQSPTIVTVCGEPEAYNSIERKETSCISCNSSQPLLARAHFKGLSGELTMSRCLWSSLT